jgi:hypothetical protein
MRKMQGKFIVCAFLAGLIGLGAVGAAQAKDEKTAYPAMAPLDDYLMADENAEIALARTAAPAGISDKADVMVLKRDGYVTAAKGSNGFVCLVERGWATESDAPDHWNPKLRAPHCFNAAAARTFADIYLFKTKLVLAGKSKKEVLDAVNAAFASGELPALAPGAMVYMMSKQQYLGDGPKQWHPHVMFIVAGDVAKTWGTDVDASPVIGVNDPEERVTIFMMLADKWSDGTAGPEMKPM